MFKVGDIVKVKENANKIESYLGIYFAEKMKEYLGGNFVITYVGKTGEKYYYHLGSDNWSFAEEWLEQVNDKEIKIQEKDFEELLCLK